MDEDTCIILQEWSLGEYIDIFKENKIDINTLNIIDQGMVKELIKPVGDRAKFLQNLHLWKQISLPDPQLPLPQAIDQYDDDDMCVTDPSIKQQDADIYVDVLSEKHRNLHDISNLQQPQTDPSPVVASTSTRTTDKQDADIYVDVLSEKHRNLHDISNLQQPQADPSPVVASTSTTTTDKRSLLNLLNKSAKGRNLMKLHKEEGVLSSSSRRNICNIIVEDLLSEDPNVRVKHETLFSIAQEIKNIFPKESISTYFVPYVNNNKIKVKTCAKGKLYDCLHNRKRQYREAEKKNDILKAEQVTDRKKNLQNQKENDKVDDDVQQNIIWLHNSIEPWQMVQKKWRETATYRLKCLNTSDKTVAQYMTEFPALKNPAGYTLLIEDFKILYPDKESSLHENFCLYKEKILSCAKQKATRDESLKKIIQELENLSEESDDIKTTEAKTIIAFMVLPLLLGNPLAKVKKNSWRPSKQESSEGFISHITSAGELQTTISSRREKFSKLNVTLQPFIVIIGCNFTEISKYYIVINDTIYMVHSIINAVDVCFKIFHALSCTYPIECSSTWQFIQKGLYNLQTPYDKQFVSVNSLISDLGMEIG